MSWHFLQEQEEVSSEGISWDGERFAPSSGQTTLVKYCFPDSEMESCHDSRSGMMSRPSTEIHGKGGSMSSAEDSPARTSPPQARVPESTAQDLECGSTWLESFARFDPDSSSWKTPQCSLLAGLDVFSETWPRWGSMRNGACWDAQMLGDGTFANGCGLLPTPMAADGTTAGAINRTKNGKFWNLRDWYRAIMQTQAGEHARQRKPEFWEWLMGWPETWTALKPLETAKFQQWRQSHSGFSLKDLG